jgi:hypothetical protein
MQLYAVQLRIEVWTFLRITNGILVLTSATVVVLHVWLLNYYVCVTVSAFGMWYRGRGLQYVTSCMQYIVKALWASLQ